MVTALEDNPGKGDTMSEIPAAVIAKMMVKCGRRCCICKRYRPTKLQVHHIHEKAEGGGDEEDNLIVTCFSCHSDVHTLVPFARRFSRVELKGHRDALVKQVAEGVFPVEDTDDMDEIIRAVVCEMRKAPAAAQVQLLPEAAEILLGAVNAKDGGQGSVFGVRDSAGFSLVVGGGDLITDHTDMRLAAKYRHALDQLVRYGFLEHLYQDGYEVTYRGYLAADEITVRGVQALSE
jgi:HNH endonuclease